MATTSSKTQTEAAGKVERLVRMDYSGAYRENEKLDDHLDECILSLKRSAHRRLTEREEELETARADADKILKLKEVVNSRAEGEEDSVAIVCSSWRKRSVSSAKRKMSLATSGCLRRPSSLMSSSIRDCAEEGEGGGGEEDDVMVGDPFSSSTTTTILQFPDLKTMSLTERRLAKERDQFSARNLFNVRRKSSSAAAFMESRRRDVSPDTAATTMNNSNNNNSNSNKPPSSSPNHRQRGRPRTSPAAYGRGRQDPSNKARAGYMRPTTASVSRLTSTFSRSGVEEEEDGSGFPRATRRPRSRRELQRLVELKVDPFGEEEQEKEKKKKKKKWASGRRDSWTSNEDRRQDLLHDLQMGQPLLQARVTAFLRTLEDFTRRDRKTGLEQILEAT